MSHIGGHSLQHIVNFLNHNLVVHMFLIIFGEEHDSCFGVNYNVKRRFIFFDSLSTCVFVIIWWWVLVIYGVCYISYHLFRWYSIAPMQAMASGKSMICRETISSAKHPSFQKHVLWAYHLCISHTKETREYYIICTVRWEKRMRKYTMNSRRWSLITTDLFSSAIWTTWPSEKCE